MKDRNILWNEKPCYYHSRYHEHWEREAVSLLSSRSGCELAHDRFRLASEIRTFGAGQTRFILYTTDFINSIFVFKILNFWFVRWIWCLTQEALWAWGSGKYKILESLITNQSKTLILCRWSRSRNWIMHLHRHLWITTSRKTRSWSSSSTPSKRKIGAIFLFLWLKSISLINIFICRYWLSFVQGVVWVLRAVIPVKFWCQYNIQTIIENFIDILLANLEFYKHM